MIVTFWSLIENKRLTPSKMRMKCMWSFRENNESILIFFPQLIRKLTLNTDKLCTVWKQLPLIKKVVREMHEKSNVEATKLALWF